MASYWRVVGGGDGKGGIIVRVGQATTSAMAEERLAHGALIKEKTLVDGRLEYTLVDGTGPTTGWVSLALKDKPLVERAEAPAASENGHTAGDPSGPRFPDVYLDTPGGQTVFRRGKYKEWADDYFERLFGGKVVGPLDKYVEGRVNEGKWVRDFMTVPGRQEPGPKDYIDTDFDKQRIQAEQVGTPLVQQQCQPGMLKMPPPYKKMTKAQIEVEAQKMLPGDMYGVELPPTLQELEKLGAPWLTRALHAAGTLPKDNSVKSIVNFHRLPTTSASAAGGAGPKAFLTVEYEKDDANLHTELFVKLPWATTGTKADGADMHWRYNLSGPGGADGEFQEVTVYRFLGPIFPFKIPKFYFGDICRENTNYVLITEKVLFGGSAKYFGAKGKKDFKPYEIMPVSEKYFDFKLEPRMRYEMYFCVTRCQARMAAWDMLGKFDVAPIESRGIVRHPLLPSMFEWPVKMKPAKRQSQVKSMKLVAAYYRELLADRGKKAFPKEFTDPKFLDALEELVVEAGAYIPEINNYFSLFPHMIAMQHVNLQADNAYYWRNANGELDCGIIDWGGACPKSINGEALTSGWTAAEGEVLHEYDVRLLRCFKDEYFRECGIELDLEEMERQWHLAYCVYTAGVGLSIEREIFRETPRQEWDTISDLMDTRVLDRWNCRCYSFMIRILCRYLYLRWRATGSKRLHVLETFYEWKDYWVEKGMT